jgi:hypothetical protein
MKVRLCFLVIVFVGVACRKEEDEKNAGPNGPFLKQLVFDNGMIEEFMYTNHGLLSRHEKIVNGEVEEYETFSYKKEQLDSSSLYIYSSSAQSYFLMYKRAYLYNGDGSLVNYSEEDVLNKTYKYFQLYYKDQKIDSIAWQLVDEAFGMATEGYYKFTTDINGNILTSKKTLMDEPDIYPLIGYQYDTMNNPLKNLANPSNFTIYFSSGNVIKDATSSYAYEYNEDNLPVSRNQRYGYAPFDTVNMTMDFIYYDE